MIILQCVEPALHNDQYQPQSLIVHHARTPPGVKLRRELRHAECAYPSDHCREHFPKLIGFSLEATVEADSKQLCDQIRKIVKWRIHDVEMRHRCPAPGKRSRRIEFSAGDARSGLKQEFIDFRRS
jgi:hypothetical protein